MKKEKTGKWVLLQDQKTKQYLCRPVKDARADEHYMSIGHWTRLGYDAQIVDEQPEWVFLAKLNPTWITYGTWIWKGGFRGRKD